MDNLIQHRIVSHEIAHQLSEIVPKQERCRAMLHQLLTGGNPQAFVVLHEALKTDYEYMVKMIDEAAGSLSIS